MTGSPAARLSFFGRVATGKGEAAGFTGAEWARESFLRLVGIAPFPGTLNLTVEDPASRAAWEAIRRRPGIRMAAPDPAWCDGRLYPVVMSHIAGAIVLPEVAGYAPDQVEIIAAVGLRTALGLADGDRVEVALAEEGLR